MDCQRSKFDLPKDVVYFNCAYLAPALKSSQIAGIHKIKQSAKPYLITQDDFFNPVDDLRSSFARLIGCDDKDRIAVNTSVSYGLANVIKQIRPQKGSNVVIPMGEFPSNVHAWRRLCSDFDCELRTISASGELSQRGENWNASILDAIDSKTCAVAITPLHWSGGTVFNLPAIRDKCRVHDVFFIIDGTQAIGAIPFDIKILEPDAVLCAGYKWLLGPYGISLAYYGPRFDQGVPIEENWITHVGCNNLRDLVDSDPELLPKGLRYSSGQHPSFIYVSMLSTAIDQLLKWDVENINSYCTTLHNLLIKETNNIHDLILINKEEYYSPHLFGMWFPPQIDINKLYHRLKENKIFVSLRGDVLRISLHVFNDENDICKLAKCINEFV